MHHPPGNNSFISLYTVIFRFLNFQQMFDLVFHETSLNLFRQLLNPYFYGLTKLGYWWVMKSKLVEVLMYGFWAALRCLSENQNKRPYLDDRPKLMSSPINIPA